MLSSWKLRGNEKQPNGKIKVIFSVCNVRITLHEKMVYRNGKMILTSHINISKEDYIIFFF